MADLIDRDALLKDLKSDCPESEVCISETSCIECIIGSQPAVNRWIPCSERMPEENVYVIAWAKRKHYSRAIMAILINGIWKIGVNDCSDGFHVQGEITHWMPLPEPPEEGEENACH